MTQRLATEDEITQVTQALYEQGYEHDLIPPRATVKRILDWAWNQPTAPNPMQDQVVPKEPLGFTIVVNINLDEADLARAIQGRR